MILSKFQKQRIAEITAEHNRKVYKQMSDAELGMELQKEEELYVKLNSDLLERNNKPNQKFHGESFVASVRLKENILDCKSRISLINEEFATRDKEFAQEQADN